MAAVRSWQSQQHPLTDQKQYVSFSQEPRRDHPFRRRRASPFEFVKLTSAPSAQTFSAVLPPHPHHPQRGLRTCIRNRDRRPSSRSLAPKQANRVRIECHRGPTDNGSIEDYTGIYWSTQRRTNCGRSERFIRCHLQAGRGLKEIQATCGESEMLQEPPIIC